MICKNCRSNIPDDSEFCQYCGKDVQKEIDAPEIHFIGQTSNSSKLPNSQKQTAERPTMSKKTKTAIISSVIVFSVIAVVVVLLLTLIIPNSKYEHAQELLEEGKYDLAYSAFLELGSFSDSEEKLLETRYLQAISYRDKGDYEIANKIFEGLGNYRDSKALIHIHDYKKTSTTPKTCTSNGSETYTCTSCDNSYIITIDASHNYNLVSEKAASCTVAGEKKYSCSACGDSYIDLIAVKSHNYKSATCTAPKTCSECGKTEGSALGHSDSIICSRCGENTFETLVYSGKGSKVISNINLPRGKFQITCTMISGEGATDIKFNVGGTEHWLMYATDAGESEVEFVEGPINSAVLTINADSNYFGKSGWKITIEAVGN